MGRTILGTTTALLEATGPGLDWGGHSGGIQRLSLQKEAGSEGRMTAK